MRAVWAGCSRCSFPIFSTFSPVTSNSLLTAGRWGCSCLPADPFQGLMARGQRGTWSSAVLGR